VGEVSTTSSQQLDIVQRIAVHDQQVRQRAGETGLHVTASKTANSTCVKQTFTWLDEEGRDTGLRAAVDEALAARPVDLGPWAFCTDEGDCYVDADTGKTRKL
jgi:hypothetical protein